MLFFGLMALCLVSILSASVGVGGKAGAGLGLAFLTLQGFAIFSYAQYLAC